MSAKGAPRCTGGCARATRAAATPTTPAADRAIEPYVVGEDAFTNWRSCATELSALPLSRRVASFPYWHAVALMSYLRRSQYRGSAVTVRWKEMPALPPARLFAASYRIGPHDTQATWHQFAADLVFQTADTAAAYALAEAHRAIDSALLGASVPRRRRRAPAR